MELQAWMLMLGHELGEAEKLGIPEEQRSEFMGKMAQAVCEELPDDRQIIRNFAAALSTKTPSEDQAENDAIMEWAFKVSGYNAARKRAARRFTFKPEKY
jgi:hypothetical protein